MRSDQPPLLHGPPCCQQQAVWGGPLLIRTSLPAGTTSVRDTLACLLAALAPLGLTREEAVSAELVMAEVLNNIAEHAYADSTGRVEVELRLTESCLRCEVRDFGRPMPAGTPPDLPVVRTRELPEGGFGWLLIRTIAIGLDYRRDGGTNRLSFMLPLAPK